MKYNIDSVKIGGFSMVQQRQTYHHKDLRNALIETGIHLVNTEGVNSFSLRKVAAACGVSHAAPYSHFQNKEELLEAMQLFITDRFSKQLESAVQKNNNVVEILKDMGISCSCRHFLIRWQRLSFSLYLNLKRVGLWPVITHEKLFIWFSFPGIHLRLLYLP